MTHFLMHLNECDQFTPDEEGRDLPDIVTARREAINAARWLMIEEMKEGRLCMSCSIEVINAETGESLLVPLREAVEITGL